jgi:hypothetical protein
MAIDETAYELLDAGLLREADGFLTPKGRRWLRLLESTATREIAGDGPAELVMSTNALTR